MTQSNIHCVNCLLPQFRCPALFTRVPVRGLLCKPCYDAHCADVTRAEREARLEQEEWLAQERDDLWSAHFRDQPACPVCSLPLDISSREDRSPFVFCGNKNCRRFDQAIDIPDPVRGA